MDVCALPRTEVVRRLRERVEKLEPSPTNDLVRNWSNYEALVLERSPGQTLGETRDLAGRESRRLKTIERTLLLGMASLEVGGLATLALGHPLAGLGGMVAGLGLLALAGPIHRQREKHESTYRTALRCEISLSQPPPRPTQASAFLENPLTTTGSEHTRTELLTVLNATLRHFPSGQTEYLGAHLRLGYERELVGRVGGESFTEMRQSTAQKVGQARKQARLWQAASALTLVGCAAPLALSGPAGWVTAGLSLVGAGGLFFKSLLESGEASELSKLPRVLDDWAPQLESLKQPLRAAQEAELGRLSGQGGRTTRLAAEHGVLTVGGVRLQVRTQVSVPTSSQAPP